jgi:hypothetical protein
VKVAVDPGSPGLPVVVLNMKGLCEVVYYGCSALQISH